jgi:two-component system CheB/CheR fusion protein
MPDPSRSPLLRYGGAVAVVAAMAGIRFALGGVVGVKLPYIVFFPAIILTAWYGGLGASVLAVAFSTLAAKYFFIPEVQSLRVADPVDLIGLALFVTVCAALIAFSEANRASRRRLEREAAERRRAEALIERDSLLLANVRDSVIVTDLDGVVTFWNKGAERIFGWTAAEMLGRPLVDRMPEQARPKAAEAMRRIAAGEEFRGEWADQRKDGNPIWIEALTTLIRDSSGRPVGLMGVSIDVTERRRVLEAVRESERRLQQLADTMPQVVWTADPDGAIEYFNRRFYEYTGTPPGPAFAEEGWRAFVHPEDLGLLHDVRVRAVGGSEAFETEARLRGRDGEYRWHLIRSVPVHDEQGRVVRRFGSATDIDDLKRAVAALRQADRRKDEFLATLAHELRNPLASVRNALHLIGRGPEAEIDVEAERAMAERQVAHLAHLIDDLMDVSRIGRGTVELRRRPADLSAVVGRAVEAIRSSARERGHDLTISLPEGRVFLDADPTRLEQVFANLLSNAVKYTDPGGRIRLAAERDGADVVVRVRDNGVGIEPDMLPRVFDMFVQAGDPLTRPHGGLGIGLSLVKALVELHGGIVMARSEGRGRGSEFIVRLPALPAPPGKPEGPGPAGRRQPGAGRPPRRRVLVVDDNVDAATSLVRILSRLYGQDVRVAHDGPEALRSAEEFLPEVVILDIGMPGMDGYEVARRLRGRPGTSAATIIALTGWGQGADRARSKEAGFDHHLVKPVDPETLCRHLAGTANAARGIS